MFSIDEESRIFLQKKIELDQSLRVFFGGYGWGGPSMGLALDEPKEGDEHYTVNDLPIIVDPFAMKIIKESGGLNIRSSTFGPTAELAGAACGSGCSCS